MTSTSQEPHNRCFHGGAFFEAVGNDFAALDRAASIINADVLDAWFPPAPAVLNALREHLPWLVRTSPPTTADGLVRTIAKVRGVPAESIVVAAGSSALIFLAFREWLSSKSRVLLLDPTYGEYAHVCERVISCHVERFRLRREEGYRLDLKRFAETLREGDFDLVVVVNPNNPTGQTAPADALYDLLGKLPARTRCWIDEAYLEYSDAVSLEPLAAECGNVVVCKSLSKVFALSGMRAAYLVGRPETVSELRRLTPPWAVGLSAQVAAVKALQSPNYYTLRYADTAALRRELVNGVRQIDPRIEVVDGCGNFVLFHLPESGPLASEVVARCRTKGLFLRDARLMGASLGSFALRAAVKDRATQQQMLEILGWALAQRP